MLPFLMLIKRHLSVEDSEMKKGASDVTAVIALLENGRELLFLAVLRSAPISPTDRISSSSLSLFSELHLL